MSELFLLVSPILSDFKSIYFSRFGSLELAKGGGSRTWAAGDKQVSNYVFDLRRSYDLLGILVSELFLLVSPILSDFKSIHFSRFGSLELAKGGGSRTWAAGDKQVSNYVFDLRRSYDLLGILVSELFLLVSPILSDFKSIHFSRFGSLELAKGGGSRSWAAGDKQVGNYVFDLRRNYDP